MWDESQKLYVYPKRERERRGKFLEYNSIYIKVTHGKIILYIVRDMCEYVNIIFKKAKE